MRLYSKLIFFSCFSLIIACQQDDDADSLQEATWNNHEPFQLEYNIPFELDNAGFFSEQADARGETNLQEISGIVPSIANLGHIWAHEDSSNPNVIYLLDATTCETVASYELEGMINRDWEDIEIGPGPEEGVNYIYLGEVGDNHRAYGNYKVFRFEEPIFEESHRGQKNPITTPIETIDFRYPDGLRYDVETLLLDPWTKDLFLVTKRDFFSIIYVLPYPQKTSGFDEPIKVGEFPFTRAVGGNISLDGKEMLVKTYDHIMYWERQEDESMVDMFMKSPKLAPYNPPEPQGEAICFDQNGGYFTISEYSNSVIPVLYYYSSLR